MNEAVQVQESDQRGDLVVRRGGGRRGGHLAEADILLFSGITLAGLIWGAAIIL